MEIRINICYNIMNIYFLRALLRIYENNYLRGRIFKWQITL